MAGFAFVGRVHHLRRQRRDPPLFSFFYCGPTRLSRRGVRDTHLGKRSPRALLARAQDEQQGKRHRRTLKELHRDLLSGYQMVKMAWMDVEVAKVVDDMVSALAVSEGGTRTCVECEYENERDLYELEEWHAKNVDMLDRWLQLKGCHLMRTVSVGGCGHVSMPWQLEERRKRAV